MIKEQFLGRNPSHFKTNLVAKLFITAEMFLWSAWNLITPIFAVFVVRDIQGGNIEIAASAISIYFISRVVFELVSGRYLNFKVKKEIRRFVMVIIGMVLISIGYLGFALSFTILSVFCFYALIGMGVGIVSPAKNFLFSGYLNKSKQAWQWSAYDVMIFIGMAFAIALGGFIANDYGFRTLFCISSIVNILGIIPYVLYIF